METCVTETETHIRLAVTKNDRVFFSCFSQKKEEKSQEIQRSCKQTSIRIFGSRLFRRRATTKTAIK